MTSPFDLNEAARLTNLTEVWQDKKIKPSGEHISLI